MKLTQKAVQDMLNSATNEQWKNYVKQCKTNNDFSKWLDVHRSEYKSLIDAYNHYCAKVILLDDIGCN